MPVLSLLTCLPKVYDVLRKEMSPSTASVDSFRPRSAPALASPPQIMLDEAPAATPAPPQSARSPWVRAVRVGSEDIPESARQRRRNADAATYPCSRSGCTATFTRSHNLKSETSLSHTFGCVTHDRHCADHEKSHDSQQSYVCEFCGAWFSRSYDRTRHIARSCPHSKEAGPSS
jgi:hypothetical protein